MTIEDRPAPPAHGMSRRLRHLAGVDETVLDWVPEERPRYTRLGAIVANTGILAALSLFVALQSVIHAPLLAIVPVALLWGFLIVTFDGWLIASTHGSPGHARWRLMVPRLIVSVLLGVVIAEPLVLWVFRPAIEAEVHRDRAQSLTSLQSDLVRCNRDRDAAVRDSTCAGYVLNSVSADPQREELAAVERQRDVLGSEVAEADRRYAALEATARQECNGTAGSGLTGKAGEGVNCRRLRSEADSFRSAAALDVKRRQMVDLDRRIDALTAAVGQASQMQADEIQVGIQAVMSDRRAAQGQIGLLERTAALEKLSDGNAAVSAAQWLLRLLLIVIDCLPILTALMSRVSSYDHLLSRRLATSERLHQRMIDMEERRAEAETDVSVHQTEWRWRSRIDRLEEQERLARAQREVDLDQQIDDLATRLRGV